MNYMALLIFLQLRLILLRSGMIVSLSDARNTVTMIAMTHHMRSLAVLMFLVLCFHLCFILLVQ